MHLPVLGNLPILGDFPLFVVQSFLSLLYKTETSGLLDVLVVPHRRKCLVYYNGVVRLGPRPGLVAIVNKYFYFLLGSNP